MGKSLQTKQIANEVLWIVVGCLLYSLSVVWFIDPAQIIPGSVTGIAVVTKALFGIPIGVLNLVVNIPLVLIGVFYLGIPGVNLYIFLYDGGPCGCRIGYHQHTRLQRG